MLRILSLLGTISAAWAASLFLWEHFGQTGTYRVIYGPTPNFVDIDFNDEVSSVSASGRDWELYGDVNYEGTRMVLRSGQSIDTYENDYYSSARPLCAYGDPAIAELTIYEHHASQGASKVFTGPSDWLGDEWNDKITSVYANKGDWELYGDLHYEGAREVVSEGQSINLARNDYYSSLRPVCENYNENRKCILEKVEVIDNGHINPLKETQIIGSVNGGSCYNQLSQTLTLSSTDSVEQSFSLETSESSEKNWYISASLQVEIAAKFLGTGSSITVGVEAGGGGSQTIGKSETKSYSTGNEQLAGLSINYEVPGAALLLGVVDRYTVNNAEVPVRMHLKCPDGSITTTMSTMKLKSVTYPSATYFALSAKFNKEACKENRLLPDCVKAVGDKYAHSIANKRDIISAFNLCFADGKGSFGK